MYIKNNRLLLSWGKVRSMSSPYGLYKLGYACATKKITISNTIEQFKVNL